ncbi:SipW-dependent-type signal peptide-containing protein [Natrarchaeobaculum sulfurireducens]|uniref:von Willebrand factor type A n=1 Tax=Natrarchaeobaculum sulfurireducens TaxID=2044521 RepID=A0A346P9Z8_9EURY|nr:SipW-dependent-type signal peptide-containing protein [Natrarchaeobaculum sulfurireducens]AXR76343.1 von Willebrand factor type A [Natrarchaeobaculum sulfurireducens]
MTKKIKLTRRKALAGIGAIGAASAGAGLGTSAFFSDREAFEGNTLTAGELDLRIDWQQLYFGPEANKPEIDFEPYGTAGYPFVNAHPDDNTDGMQSVDLSEFDDGTFADDSEIATYIGTFDNDDERNDGVAGFEKDDVIDGANVQEYITCETLENFEEPDDYDNGVRTQDSLIELEDVKPGDCGEVTFSLHLCDNPGYIWWIGQVNEFDDDLAKAIDVKAWYDLECTNEFDEEDGDRTLLETTDLYTFVQDRITPDGRLLDPNVYDGAGVGGGDALEAESEVVCEDLDKIEFEDEDEAQMENGEILGYEEGDELKIIALFAAPGEDDTQLVVQFSNILFKDEDDNEVLAKNRTDADLEEIVQYDWAILDEYEGVVSSDVAGMCSKRIKAGPDEEEDDLVTFGGCTRDQDGVRTPSINPVGNNPRGISHIEFEYCSADRPPLCFPEEETFCVAFEWCLPTTSPEHVDDINELQGQSISFDLGFYTEQCRHNELPEGPAGF